MPQEVSPTSRGLVSLFSYKVHFFCAHDAELGISTAKRGMRNLNLTHYLGILANSVSTPGKSFFPRRFHTVRQTQ